MRNNRKEIQEDYSIRINRVFEYIDENLNSDLSLETVAALAFFSPFHFHRIFKFITDETLNKYVTRRRIEKSALDLLHKNITATEISHNLGYSDISAFSKAFKKYYGLSPTEFRKQNPYRYSKIRQLHSKNRQDYPDYGKYICIIDNLSNWIKMNAKIEIKNMPEMDLAYVTSIGPQNLEEAYSKLIQWAKPLGLMNEDSRMVTIYHDSFKITEANKIRMSASILLPQPVQTAGEIGQTSIPAGRYIVGSLEIAPDEFEKSWTGLFLWMNENGYKKSDRNPFEIYHNNFNEHPERKAIVDFYIPIE